MNLSLSLRDAVKTLRERGNRNNPTYSVQFKGEMDVSYTNFYFALLVMNLKWLFNPYGPKRDYSPIFRIDLLFCEKLFN